MRAEVSCSPETIHLLALAADTLLSGSARTCSLPAYIPSCLQEALSLGLVLEVVEPDRLMQVATDYARRIAGERVRGEYKATLAKPH